MKKEFIVERQGKAFVLYAGLLDLGHQQGLKSVRTELVQVPSEANNRVAICTAIVTLERDGIERTFTGIGDAAPNNVAPAMQTCLVRMAETRAKARALRDAVNVGVAAFEELPDDDAHDSAPERGYAMGNARASRFERMAARAGNPGGGAAQPAAARAEQPTPIPAEMRNPSANPRTEAQADAIRSLCRRGDMDPDILARERYDVEGLDKLSQMQASELIKALNNERKDRAAA